MHVRWAVPAPIVCDTSIGCVWFSDFDGAEATETHFVVNRAGLMVGWAKYQGDEGRLSPALSLSRNQGTESTSL